MSTIYRGYEVTTVPNMDGKTMLVTVRLDNVVKWSNLHAKSEDDGLAWVDAERKRIRLGGHDGR